MAQKLDLKILYFDFFPSDKLVEDDRLDRLRHVFERLRPRLEREIEEGDGEECLKIIESE